MGRLAFAGSFGDLVGVARIAGALKKIRRPITELSKFPDLATSSDLAKLLKAIEDLDTELPSSIARSLKEQGKLKRAAQLGLITGSDLVNGSDWARWLVGINPETYKSLAKPGVAKALREASPEVRDLFTKCASDCLPPWFKLLTPAQRNDVVRRMTELEKGASKEAKDAWQKALHDLDVDDVDGVDRLVSSFERAAGGGGRQGDFHGPWRALTRADWGRYLSKNATGTGIWGKAKPQWLIDRWGSRQVHAHHILPKAGTRAQRALVEEGQRILRNRGGIDPIWGTENLVWAPNKAAVHTTDRIRSIVERLRAVDQAGGGPSEIRAVLREFGEQAANLSP